jgi:hypothetical protein
VHRSESPHVIFYGAFIHNLYVMGAKASTHFIHHGVFTALAAIFAALHRIKTSSRHCYSHICIIICVINIGGVFSIGGLQNTNCQV